MIHPRGIDQSCCYRVIVVLRQYDRVERRELAVWSGRKVTVQVVDQQPVARLVVGYVETFWRFPQIQRRLLQQVVVIRGPHLVDMVIKESNQVPVDVIRPQVIRCRARARFEVECAIDEGAEGP